MHLVVVVQEELRMPLDRDDGPVGLIICPSRELASQTYSIAEEYGKVRYYQRCPPVARGRHD